MNRKKQIANIQYWWLIWGNLEKWDGWQDAKKDFLPLNALLDIRTYLDKTIDHVVWKLGEER